MSTVFSEYYEQYLGYTDKVLDKRNIHNCNVCITNIRDIPLNKRFIYRILITEYNNSKIISVSSNIKKEIITGIAHEFCNVTIDDLVTSKVLCNTGLRISKMYRMTLSEVPLFDYKIDKSIIYIDEGRKYIMVEDNQMISYCKISDIHYGYGNIVVWTDENHRCKGYAKKLLILIINKCRAEGIEPLYLVNSQNYASIALARSIGFEICQTELIGCEEV